MTKRFHILILIVTIGFFLIPSLSYSCEMKSEKSCCNKQMPSSSEKMDCCKKSNNSKTKDKEHEGACNGNCGHSNCTSSSVHFNVVFFEINYNSYNFNFSEKKQNYFNTESNLSSGFTSVWLIPKIG